jgi:hypothetical protein
MAASAVLLAVVIGLDFAYDEWVKSGGAPIFL